MDFRDRHIVVTGGAGALGTAVVTALIEAGAICHVPCFNDAEAERLRLRAHKQVVATVAGNLADEANVAGFYACQASLGAVWAAVIVAAVDLVIAAIVLLVGSNSVFDTGGKKCSAVVPAFGAPLMKKSGKATGATSWAEPSG